MHAAFHERESALTAALDPQSIETVMQVLQELRAALDPVPRRRRWSAAGERRLS